MPTEPRSLRPGRHSAAEHHPEFTILFAPGFQANASEDGTNSETCIVINFKKRMGLICGTQYAGEMKKSEFTPPTGG
jgi:phosphoenolpyruvate carboxykinase (ATP)